VFLGESNDSIIGDTDFPNSFLQNLNIIKTGDGDDIITTTGPILNSGIIETGNGDESIIVDADIDDINGTTYGIQNYGGAINMGDGNDSIIANKGFESAENSSGAWFLGEGDDYIKGYGSGDFYGGNGNDTLELTPGTYTVGTWGEGWDTSAIFTKGNQLMITSEFEKLKAGSTIYDFTSLTAGQIICVSCDLASAPPSPRWGNRSYYAARLNEAGATLGTFKDKLEAAQAKNQRLQNDVGNSQAEVIELGSHLETEHASREEEIENLRRSLQNSDRLVNRKNQEISELNSRLAAANQKVTDSDEELTEQFEELKRQGAEIENLKSELAR
jgi:hypothetical protein